MATPLEQLTARAKAGTLALLLGPDLPTGLTGVPSRSDLAQGLAAATVQPATASLVRAADGLPTWRYSQLLTTQVGGAREPGPLHRAIAALPLLHFLNAAWDDGLAEGLEPMGRSVNSLVEDSDLDALGYRLSRPDLVWLCGQATGARRLVVTEQEHRRLPDAARTRLFQRVSGWLQGETVVLVGCAPAAGSDWERWLYGEVLGKKLGGFAAGAFLLWPTPAPTDVARWAARNVTVVEAEPLAFLTALAEALADTVPPARLQPELEALLGLLVSGAPSSAVAAQVQQVPASQTLDWVRLTFRLRLSPTDEVEAALRVELHPDVANGFDEAFRPTGVSLAALQTWSEEADAAWWGGATTLDGSPVEQAGQAFFEALLPSGSSARQAYQGALFLKQAEFAAQLFLVFQAEAARLAPVAWELLHDGSVGWQSPIGPIRGSGWLGRAYPLYRRADSATPAARLRAPLRRALVVGVDPTGQLAQLQEEVDTIATLLQAAGIACDVLYPDDPGVASVAAFRARLRGGDYGLLHFAGHGAFDPATPAQSHLLLGHPFHEERLLAGELAEIARDSVLRFVFLSGCEVGQSGAGSNARPWEAAGVADALTRAGVPATLGMRWRIGDANARALAEAFYRALMQGEPGPAALLRARQAIPGTGWANPVLVQRHGAL